jgi:hypothetical protein
LNSLDAHVPLHVVPYQVVHRAIAARASQWLGFVVTPRLQMLTAIRRKPGIPARGLPLGSGSRCRSFGRAVEALEPRLALAAGPVVITELMYHPASPSASEDAAGFEENDFEFVELHNNGSDAVPLEGYTISGGIEFTFPAVTLAGGQYLVVVSDLAGFQARYGAAIQVSGVFDGTLANGGESIVLKNAAEETLLDFSYDDHWQPETDGDGPSLVIVDPNAASATWSSATNWTASAVSGGTPGQGESSFDATPPTAPAGLVATVASSSRVDLAWQASSDPESGVAGYRVYRDGQLVGTTLASAYSDTSAIGNSQSTYIVRAVNGGNLEGAASNAAVANIPPTGAFPTFAPGVSAGIAAIDYRETSGMVGSRTNPNVFYVHNDGPRVNIAAINSHGAQLGIISLTGIATIDTEEIARGPGPTSGMDYLYLGDIGDNDSNRTSISVVRIPEPVFNANGGGSQSTTIGRADLDVVTLRFPAGAVDSEAMIVDPLTGDLYIFAKDNNNSRVFRAAAGSLVDNATVFLQLVGTVPVSQPSAADISPDGREILVRNETRVRLFQRAVGQSIASALAGTPIPVPVIGTPTEPNGEAIAFDDQGNNYYTLSEGRDQPLYYFHRTSISPGAPTNAPGDFNGDGIVGLSDLAILQSNLGTASGATALTGDLTGDGAVNRADVARFASLFGSTTPISSPVASPSSSPAQSAAVVQRVNAMDRVNSQVALAEPVAHVEHGLRVVARRSAIATASRVSPLQARATDAALTGELSAISSTRRARVRAAAVTATGGRT